MRLNLSFLRIFPISLFFFFLDIKKGLDSLKPLFMRFPSHLIPNFPAKSLFLFFSHFKWLDTVTDSDWKEINVAVNVKKEKMTSDLAALNQYGSQLNQTQCSSCHAAISADHYTANQWIGVVNSMKDRTSMNKDEVRALTIYLQRNAKDMAKK